MNERALSVYGQLCAATLAHGHARSGDRIAIASYLGGGNAFDRALLGFAHAYAEQNERDFAALAAAVRAGPVAAEAVRDSLTATVPACPSASASRRSSSSRSS